MKIVVTGASGFVGRNLVPFLIRPEVELLLVGRDPEQLSRMFPGQQTCGYAELGTYAKAWDQLLHLAVVNTNSDAVAEEFERVNVDLLMDVAATAQRIGIKRFVNVSSVHALDSAHQHPYAVTKRQAVSRLAALADIEIVTVYLPMVHGEAWAGRLEWLNRLPKVLARPIFGLAAAFRPTVDVRRLADFVLSTPHPRPFPPGEIDNGILTELVLSDGQMQNPWYAAIKRTADLAVALGILLVFWWALLVVWATIRVTSSGPGLFAQTRIGRDGREFTSYKFRTMKMGTPQAGTHEISASAVTPLGRFLRRTKLDELPQIVNILRNDMSLIGPRPCLPGQTDLIEARRRLGVLEVKPGISGLAQVNGIDMSTPWRLASWDAHYIAMRSLALDARIALLTVMGRGQGDKVKT
ncbi:MAG: sugar transferase [Hoeflea sp.]|uniref:hybrid nucleoside-diphosphate sugar epimerase/sugar transferase n=1 Tax=Hoeflea sp. TaxID=1940281 RepID=UPI001D1D4E70|nr:hybrid nucleoside-diphosphate sugar epimerase/sugar transferase [Hoeflea sp.]MBU4531577.1 sugar transferase [Alphaproteobacteria bacterium]MBU4544434.1 sugar transferase [Alphaproteobacteria bacterium]MBU4550329.1 sugar transferase [Alphaproteobacteria bacterium]MBV1724853.1 sugar transferase [Hoeflea sp.]MBV1760873.1 sugar transferase [Hoeflea sp.]